MKHSSFLISFLFLATSTTFLSSCAGPKYFKKRNFSYLKIGDKYSKTKELRNPTRIEKVKHGIHSGANVFVYEWDLPKDNIINRMFTYVYVKNDTVTAIYEDPVDKYIKNKNLQQIAINESAAELNYFNQVRAENTRRFAMAMASGMQGFAANQYNPQFLSNSAYNTASVPYSPSPTIINPSTSVNYRATDNQGNTTRIRPDYSGGYRATDNQGNTTRIRPDYSGGYRATDNQGNTTRIRPDYSGGYRATDNQGNTTRIRPDYSGGYRATDNQGNTTRIRPDYSGGYRATDNQGNTTRIRPY